MKRQGDAAEVLLGEADWCVACADCRDILPLLPANCVTHVVTDPPYADRVHRGMRGNRGEAGIVTRDPGFAALAPETRRIAAQELCRITKGWIAVFTDWESLHLWIRDIESAGGTHRRPIPWVRWSSPQFNKLAPPCGSECVEFATGSQKGRRYWQQGNRTHYDTKCLRAKSHDKIGHPTEKPEGLCRDILSDIGAQPGDLILDPFTGSGKIGIAALKMGCRYLGLDTDPRWATTAAEWLAKC